MLETAEIVLSTTCLMEIASAFAIRMGVFAELQQFVEVGNPQSACSGKRQTWAPESTTAPGMSTLKLPYAEGMEMRMSRRGWPL